MKNAKRIAAALICLGLTASALFTAALAERDALPTTETDGGTVSAAPAEDTNTERTTEQRDSHGRHERPAEAEEPENAIGKDAAKQAALNEAGLTADAVGKLRARVSDKDGTTFYKVSFRFEGMKYSYRIDPLSGEVLKKTVTEAGEEEARGGRHARPSEAEEPENAIGRDAAKQAALEDAGLTAEAVEKLRARVSDKDGTTFYKVSFRFEGMKYSYRIDPLTGSVLDKTVAEAGESHRSGGQQNG
ncbi:MAG: PepSY domain-containing protein [Clostridia bacterium]|nr:PepSY domain-containing protein [Clostridia bacterium]